MTPPPPPPAPVSREARLVGTALDEAYLLTRLIAEGGMGTVFEAIHLRLRKRVAVKVIVSDLASDPEALARFRREVEVTSQLAHPHVIQLLDFGTAPTGQPYLVMEYLEGEDLAQRLGRVGRLDLASAVDIIRQLASALAVIHAKGIVHRDLKPGNVILLPREGISDFVKVVDFGISKVHSASIKLTQAFSMVGTPECMAPEQATARVDDVDHRTDQWAVACVAWQMLAGRMPFGGATLNELLERIVHADPPALGAHVPAAVEAVLRRALSKRQDDRFATITAFARAFETAAVPEPEVVTLPEVAAVSMTEAPTPPAVRRRAPAFLLAGVAMVSLAVGSALVYRARPPQLVRFLGDIGGGTPAADK